MWILYKFSSKYLSEWGTLMIRSKTSPSFSSSLVTWQYLMPNDHEKITLKTTFQNRIYSSRKWLHVYPKKTSVKHQTFTVFIESEHADIEEFFHTLFFRTFLLFIFTYWVFPLRLLVHRTGGKYWVFFSDQWKKI